jgi:calmodulin
VKTVLDVVDIKFTEAEMFKMISEIDPENNGLIPFSSFKQIILEREIQKIKGSDETELLDAFVAMGGEQDGEGCVDAEKLIATIKNEF